jgi:hypothetical protein
MKFIFISVLALCFSASSFAVTKEEVKQKTSDAASAAYEYSKEQKEQFQKEMGAKIQTLQSEMSDLKKKAQGTTGDLKLEMTEQIANLERKQSILKKELASLSKSSGKSWDQMKAGVNKAWDSLSDSYEKAKSEFQK